MKNPFGHLIKDYLYITIGISLYAFAFEFFLLPYRLTTGGVAGIGALIYYATDWFQPQWTFLLVNILLLIGAVRTLGWKFCMKTIYGVVLMTVVMSLLQEVFVSIGSPKLVGDELFMSCLIGAILQGMGLSICFSAGGSTGGTDIIAAIVNKYRNVTLGTVIMLIDVVIISSCYFVFYDIQRVIFGFVLLIVASMSLDYFLQRTRQSVEFKIYSRNPEAIANAISRSGRGVTMLNGIGWYTKYERKVLISVVRRNEQVNVFRLIKAIDPFCFVTMGNVSGVWGEGFDVMKVNEQKDKKKRRVIAYASNDETEINEARQKLGDAYEIRSLSDIGINIDNPLNSDILSTNAVLKARYVKRFYGFDSIAHGNTLNAKGDTLYALATGNPELHECIIEKMSSLEELKTVLDGQQKKNKIKGV